MTQPTRRRLLQSALAVVTALAGATAQAHEYYAAQFVIVHPWALPTEPDTTESPIYFRIENIGATDRLLRCNAAWADSIELRAGDDAKAPALKALPFGPGADLDFIAGKPHLLVKGLKAPFDYGHSYNMTMVFEKAGAINVMISVGAH